MSGATTTRAKFSCQLNYQEMSTTNNTWSVIFEPVYSGSAENREFFAYTPGGRIELRVVGRQTAAQFEVGRDYYVDFIPAPEPTP